MLPLPPTLPEAVPSAGPSPGPLMEEVSDELADHSTNASNAVAHALAIPLELPPPGPVGVEPCSGRPEGDDTLPQFNGLGALPTMPIGAPPSPSFLQLRRSQRRLSRTKRSGTESAAPIEPPLALARLGVGSEAAESVPAQKQSAEDSSAGALDPPGSLAPIPAAPRFLGQRAQEGEPAREPAGLQQASASSDALKALHEKALEHAKALEEQREEVAGLHKKEKEKLHAEMAAQQALHAKALETLSHYARHAEQQALHKKALEMENADLKEQLSRIAQVVQATTTEAPTTLATTTLATTTLATSTLATTTLPCTTEVDLFAGCLAIADDKCPQPTQARADAGGITLASMVETYEWMTANCEKTCCLYHYHFR